MLRLRSFLMILSGILVLTACSIEKRQHLKGFHIDFAHRDAATKKAKETPQVKEEKSDIASIFNENRKPHKNLLASIDNSLVLLESLDERQIVNNDHEAARGQGRYSATPDSIVCDRLTLRSGDEFAVKVTEITETEIKYKNCNHLDGPTRIIEKSKVFMIVYSNGEREVFKAQSTVQMASEAQQNSEPQLLTKSVLALVISLLSIPASIIPILGWLFGFIGMALGISALNTIKENKGKYRGRTAAILGIVFGIAGVALGSFFFYLNLLAAGFI